MPKKISILDIARLSGYSKSTVSRVLQHDPHVSEQARARICAVIQATGFSRSTVAGSMRGRQPIVMIIVGDISNYFFGAAVKEIESLLHEQGYLVVVCNSEYSGQKELSFMKMAENFRVSAILLMAAEESPELVDLVSAAGCPVLLMNRRLHNMQVDELVQDDYHCAYFATEHLLSLGHTRILHLSGGNRASNAAERHRGFEDALRDYDIHLSADMVQYGNLSWESGQAAAQRLIECRPRCTAAFIDNDMMTVGFISAFYQRGLVIPRDMSVICFDTSPALGHLPVSVSTVGRSASELGRTAAELLLERFGAPDAPPKQIVLPPVLRVQDSTGPYSSKPQPE